jgi:hypothetical protein
LIALVHEWEEDNETVIDGYNIRLQAIYSEDAAFQTYNKTQITDMLTRLAATGKAVRLSNLGMMFEDATGNFVGTNQITTDQRQKAAEYMTFIMKEYCRLIASDKQYGISFAGMTETTSGSNICPWTSGFGRNEMYEGIVNGLKTE